MSPPGITPIPLPPRRLVGTLVFAGDIEIEGEEISGCALEIDRATLITAAELPMYEQCVIITAAELQNMQAMIEAANTSDKRPIIHPTGETLDLTTYLAAKWGISVA